MMMRLAVIQMTSGLSPDANAAAVEEAVAVAAKGGAHLALTPEMTGVVDGNRARLGQIVQSEAEDQVLARLRAAAAAHKLWVLVGSLALKQDGDDSLANRSLLVDPTGAIQARYDKIHLFDVDLPSGERYRESASYKPGAHAVLAETPWTGLGMTICYDLRFAALFRSLAQAGAGIIAVPAAFTQVTGEAHWHCLLRARAIETGCFIVAPAQTGRHEDGRQTFGHSLVVSPWGEVLLDAGIEPGVSLVDIDLDAVTEARRRIPQLTHDQSFSLVNQLVEVSA
jgi:deaminated glutathione amidase